MESSENNIDVRNTLLRQPVLRLVEYRSCICPELPRLSNELEAVHVQNLAEALPFSARAQIKPNNTTPLR